ncbi:hypothetical protein DFS34DRAFT_626873 [Phlyctochytrium arcticum]|nr:hypothetical protein DFS34DRAFT_626873 [Phlyctochytrium arcticum]
MDTNYLKQTVGPLLSSALASLVTYGYDTSSSGPRGLDAISFLGEYLLNHAEAQKLIADDHKKREAIKALQNHYNAAQETQREHRRRLDDELKLRTGNILDKQRKAEEERQAQIAAELEAEQRKVAAALEPPELVDLETRRGIPEAILEGEEDREDQENTDDNTRPPTASDNLGDGPPPTDAAPTDDQQPPATPAADTSESTIPEGE